MGTRSLLMLPLWLRQSQRDVGLAALTIALFIGVTTQFPDFASGGNLRGMLDDSAVLILLAVGQMLVILTRCIDLSVAANAALSGMCVALLNRAAPELSLAILIPLAIVIGTALGACNGVLVWMLSIPSIVVTLGTMAIYRGLVYVASQGTWVTSNQMSVNFLSFVRQPWLQLSTLSWFAIMGAVLAALVLRFTITGRRFYIAGGNPDAAVYAGVSVGRTQFMAFLVSGAIAGLCGYLLVARFAVAYTDVARGFELQVIAACVIGGVSISGGIGTLRGVVLGCLFLGLLKNALPLLGVSPFWQTAVSGMVITVAVILNARDGIPSRRRILEVARR
jgi:rhamnose transport system permease protein